LKQSLVAYGNVVVISHGWGFSTSLVRIQWSLMR